MVDAEHSFEDVDEDFQVGEDEDVGTYDLFSTLDELTEPGMLDFTKIFKLEESR